MPSKIRRGLGISKQGSVKQRMRDRQSDGLELWMASTGFHVGQGSNMNYRIPFFMGPPGSQLSKKVW